jgi:anti-sigma factor RsiW
MGGHEEFLELCASATAGELSADEQAKLEAHLAICPECRRAMSEYEAAAGSGVSALAEELAPEGAEDTLRVPGPSKGRKRLFSSDWTANRNENQIRPTTMGPIQLRLGNATPIGPRKSAGVRYGCPLQQPCCWL